MCIAQAAVTSKWWLVLNVLRPSKCFTSTLREGLRGKLKENTWRSFSVARAGQPFWTMRVCLDFIALQVWRQENKRGEVHFLQGATSRKWSRSLRFTAFAVALPSVSHHQNDQSHKSVSMKPNTKPVPNCMWWNGFCHAWHCWGYTICC